MSSDWFDEVGNTSLGDEQEDTFYCPYTNSAECAVLMKGLQPQELCLALECEQVKLVQRNRGARSTDKAA